MKNIYNELCSDIEYQNLKNKFLSLVQKYSSKIDKVKNNNNAQDKIEYETIVKSLSQHRGRDLFYPLILSGLGNGPLVELLDGSVKYDMITGIGVNFYGYSSPLVVGAMFDSAIGFTMQGNLAPSILQEKLSEKLFKIVEKTRLKNLWVTTCGATANEIALKILRQKKSPATKVFCFKNCFLGRTTALQELTDNSSYRQGQPLYGEVFYLNPYDSKSSLSAKEQASLVIESIETELKKNQDKYVGIEVEIVQGEGGFNLNCKDFLMPIFKFAKEKGLYVWVDEVQTFGRSGSFFAFQREELDDLVDVVTAAKPLQLGVCLFTEELNPKPGLISGTYTASTASFEVAIKILEDLQNRCIGKEGLIAKYENYFKEKFEKLMSKNLNVSNFFHYGAMIAFTVFDGSLEKTKKFLNKLYENGVIAYYCGHNPYKIRLLPPFPVMKYEHIDEVISIIEKTLNEVAHV
jgi:4-aminobutyrate aminotransferase-like enzyme